LCCSVQTVLLCSDCVALFRLCCYVQTVLLCSDCVALFRLCCSVQTVLLCSDCVALFRLCCSVQIVLLSSDCVALSRLCCSVSTASRRFLHTAASEKCLTFVFRKKMNTWHFSDIAVLTANHCASSLILTTC
jgi:hypothetical protein